MNTPIIDKIDIAKIKDDFENNKFDEIIISFSGNIKERENIFNELINSKIPVANVIHSSAIISNFVKIGVGNIIFANVRIGPFVVIKNNNVISALCSIEHHTLLKSNNTFGPAVITSGSCTISNNNKFGTGIYIEPKVKIGDNCLLSSGIIIRQNIPNNSVVKEFSDSLSKYLDVKHVIPCANGTDALQISLMALSLKPGDEVICPSFTYVATEIENSSQELIIQKVKEFFNKI